MHLTTTEKLLIAMAYGLYGEEQLDLINFYLKCNGVDLCNPDISRTLLTLQKEAKANGYGNVIDYCEDVRYKKLIEEFNKTKREYYAVLEGNADLDEEFSYSSSEEETYEPKIQQYNKIIKTPRKKEATMALGTFTKLETVKVSNESQQQIEPKAINKSSGRTTKADASSSIKDKKRFYWKLTDEEKALDDHFDVLDDKLDSKTFTILNRIATFYEDFPPLEDQKKANKDSLTLEGTDENIKTQFDLIVNKISGVQKQEKDKSQWRSEIKILLEYFMTVVGFKKEFKEIYYQIERNALSQIVLLVLYQLQDLVVKTEDPEVTVAIGALKRYTATFYDYYKK